MSHQEPSILSEGKGTLSLPTNSSGRTGEVGGITTTPRFHRSEFLIVKETVENVLCWFKSLAALKNIKEELSFGVELVSHLLSLPKFDKKYGVDLQVLKYTIGELRAGLATVKARAMENVEVAIGEKRDIKRQKRRREERVAAVRETMERTARWVAEVAASGAYNGVRELPFWVPSSGLTSIEYN
ncbi:unnamed protein product [Tuber aestivum]|uniref:Uncharacterized protein n=1 Tax=Tuber aestivum TaxID=59557 RepID=A0A292PQJ5_9PEZI|nr:unnamed protein product [Tuber aestivum]